MLGDGPKVVTFITVVLISLLFLVNGLDKKEETAVRFFGFLMFLMGMNLARMVLFYKK